MQAHVCLRLSARVGVCVCVCVFGIHVFPCQDLELGRQLAPVSPHASFRDHSLQVQAAGT